jgi:hypothetical protein
VGNRNGRIAIGRQLKSKTQQPVPKARY